MNSNRSSKQGQAKAKANQSGKKSGSKKPARGQVSRLESAPVAQSRVRVSTREQAREGMRTVVFEEYVQDIIASSTASAYRAESFPVQPGISALFAWLADQAINYQEYRFKKLSFRYETDQASALAGKVMFAFSPDAADPIPVNKQEMLEYSIKGKSAVWQEFELPIPLNEALGRKRYIRSGTLGSNLDIKTYDFGVLFVATSGIPTASANVGELYIKYELELMTPVVQSLAAAQARSVKITGATAISTTAQFGTAPITLNGLNITIDSTGNVITFNKVGNYVLSFAVGGTGLFTSFAVPAGTQSSLVVASLGGISNAAANAGTSAQALLTVVVSARGATWTLGSWAGVATTVTALVMRVASYSEL